LQDRRARISLQRRSVTQMVPVVMSVVLSIESTVLGQLPLQRESTVLVQSPHQTVALLGR